MRCSLQGVSLTYADHREPALRDVTLSIDSGERVALMGASGSGKSTLLRLIAGLEHPDRGGVLIDGADARRRSPSERRVGMVLQDAPLYEHLSVLDNVAHPLRARGASRQSARHSATEMLARMQIASIGEARGSQISGGERRRAALARALVTRPALLLLDEPFASLEPALRMELRDEVRRLVEADGCACVHATHDGLEAMALGTRIVVLDGGRVIDDGVPEHVWRHPRSPRSALLLGSVPMNVLPASCMAVAEGSHTQALETPHRDARPIGFRPEHVRVVTAIESAAPALAGDTTDRPASEDAAWRTKATLESIDSLGDRMLACIRLDDGHLIRAVLAGSTAAHVLSGQRSPLSIGARVCIEVPASALHHFDSVERSTSP